MLLELPVQEWVLQWHVLRWRPEMHAAKRGLQLRHMHGRAHPHSAPPLPSHWRWIAWGLGDMLLELPVQKWMLQWDVLRRRSEMHAAQWGL